MCFLQIRHLTPWSTSNQSVKHSSESIESLTSNHHWWQQHNLSALLSSLIIHNCKTLWPYSTDWFSHQQKSAELHSPIAHSDYVFTTTISIGRWRSGRSQSPTKMPKTELPSSLSPTPCYQSKNNSPLLTVLSNALLSSSLAPFCIFSKPSHPPSFQTDLLLNCSSIPSYSSRHAFLFFIFAQPNFRSAITTW